MYSIIVLRIPTNNVAETSTSETRICDEAIAKTYKEILPTKVGSTLTVRTFPNSWDMILTTVTKIS